ncbi:hypothetical protein EDEG_04035, partial [Edhazardia aedis USNM 41457]
MKDNTSNKQQQNKKTVKAIDTLVNQKVKSTNGKNDNEFLMNEQIQKDGFTVYNNAFSKYMKFCLKFFFSCKYEYSICLINSYAFFYILLNKKIHFSILHSSAVLLMSCLSGIIFTIAINAKI